MKVDKFYIAMQQKLCAGSEDDDLVLVCTARKKNIMAT